MNAHGVSIVLFFMTMIQNYVSSFTFIPSPCQSVAATTTSHRIAPKISFTQLNSEPEENPTELDLNLEEMFEMLVYLY